VSSVSRARSRWARTSLAISRTCPAFINQAPVAPRQLHSISEGALRAAGGDVTSRHAGEFKRGWGWYLANRGVPNLNRGPAVGNGGPVLCGRNGGPKETSDSLFNKRRP
jgi:hypothetical protein